MRWILPSRTHQRRSSKTCPRTNLALSASRRCFRLKGELGSESCQSSNLRAEERVEESSSVRGVDDNNHKVSDG